MPVTSILMSSLAGGSGEGSGQGVANIASGLVSGITGFFQKRKANRELAKLQRPIYQVPNEVLQNQKMAQQAANEGLPSQQYNQAMQNIQRQQNNALAASGSRRGGLMALPGIQQQANDAALNLDVKNAQARMANQQKLYGVNNQVAGYRDKEFEVNQMQPYTENKNYYMGLLGAGNQNFTSGIDKLLGGSGQLLTQPRHKSRSMTAGNSSTPNYYGGYSAGSDYGTFENGY